MMMSLTIDSPSFRGLIDNLWLCESGFRVSTQRFFLGGGKEAPKNNFKSVCLHKEGNLAKDGRTTATQFHLVKWTGFFT